MKKPLVFDGGSCTHKVGFAGEDAPTRCFPPVVDGKKPDDSSAGTSSRHVICNRTVTDWTDMELLWHHTMHTELSDVTPEEHPVLLAQAPMVAKADLEKAAEILFEKFSVPAISTHTSLVLGLYSAGRTTGVVVDSGYTSSTVAAIYESLFLPHSLNQLPVGGQQLSSYLSRLLAKQDGHSGVMISQEEVRAIKHSLCYVAADYKQEMDVQLNQPLEQHYSVPDNQLMKVTTPRFQCPEALFQPPLIDVKDSLGGIHAHIHDTIQKCDIDTRTELYRNILLVGGCTMFEGLRERIEGELQQLPPATVYKKAIAPPERAYSVWIGGAIVADLLEDKGWVNRTDFLEQGNRVIAPLF
eukprot:TRINITY_DN28563_c0_g1_i1.p1 TRINITY_DN28563_c0_g1~~TRINITY_DN28563_c0_g1_i1.p1  ORF type:complete len:355 (+),score=37.07 TRINITY_DN28563_c0_g1_i1:21-1085(+)